MESKVGMGAAAAWGFAEAISWPVTAEMFLAVFAAAHPRKVLPAAGWLAVGSVAGWSSRRSAPGRPDAPAPLTTEGMRTTAAEHMAAGATGIWRQALNGIPVKVYAAEAGRRRIPLGPLAAHALGARGARALALGLSWPGCPTRRSRCCGGRTGPTSGRRLWGMRGVVARDPAVEVTSG